MNEEQKKNELVKVKEKSLKEIGKMAVPKIADTITRKCIF